MIKFWYPRTIWLFGISVGALLLVAGYRFYDPKNKEADMYLANAEELRTIAGDAKKAEKKIVDANKLVKQEEVKWNSYVAVRTPATEVSQGGINLNVNAWQLMVDTKRFRNNIQRAVNKQVISGGVKVITGPYVPGIQDNDPANQVLASYYNYPAIPFPVVIYDLGTVTVEGTMEQIFANVKSWATMPRYLAVADGLRLSGTAPRLTGTYSVSIVGYLKDSGIYPPVPEGAASAPGGAGGGGGFGGGRFGAASGPGGFGGPGGPGGPPPGFGGGSGPKAAAGGLAGVGAGK